VGATLWINPSELDFENAADGIDNLGDFAFGTDQTSSTQALNLVISQIGFSPYINAGFSNVIVATTFDEVNTTNPPVFGIQPQGGTNYSGNSAALYTAASGVDLTYQWYSQSFGALHDDGLNIIGSSSNVLVLNDLQASDTYYLIATDFYGNHVTSSNAVETIITTPTPVFFPDSVVAQNLTNNLFQFSGFTNIALGTGPIYYQWYFAPTNTPNVFSPLPGQTSSALSLDLVDFTYAGNYFVVASNAVGGGSVAVGPTNSLTELAPLTASMLQLHNFLLATTNQYLAKLHSSYYINTNNVIVSGYVMDYGASSSVGTFGGYGTTYSEFFIQDTSGLGVEVFLSGLGNTNGPPVGSYVTVTGPLEVFNGTLEMVPATQAAIVTNSAPPLTLTPKVFNSAFNDVITNLLGTNTILYGPSLVTLTNVYIYGSKTGGALPNGGIFASNAANILYCTIGQPYSTTPPVNTNVWEIFEPTYNYGPRTAPAIPYATNSCDSQVIPPFCYQVTGIYENFSGSPEIVVSRYQDYVVNPPPNYLASLTLTNISSGKGKAAAATVNWNPSPGSTYSVYSATNLAGPWTQAAYGLTYYPSNSTFTDTNSAKVKFYRVSSP
jgi:hypothetical protein